MFVEIHLSTMVRCVWSSTYEEVHDQKQMLLPPCMRHPPNGNMKNECLKPRTQHEEDEGGMCWSRDYQLIARIMACPTNQGSATHSCNIAGARRYDSIIARLSQQPVKLARKRATPAQANYYLDITSQRASTLRIPSTRLLNTWIMHETIKDARHPLAKLMCPV